ncbi:MAG: mitochondrial fission ELM1 family protein [Pseudomonadota bacterium]
MTSIWGLVDDRTGHTGQVLGVIHKLKLPYALKRLEYNALAQLPSRLLGASLLAVNTARSAPLLPPYPALVIAAGRRTLPVLRHIKQQSPTTRTVYLMKPDSTRGIDLIAIPAHDKVAPAVNIITTLAPLHAVTPETLDAARAVWEPQFAHLPRPFVTVCLGGATKRGSYNAAQWREVIQRAILLAGQGSLLITTSRRTPKEAMDLCLPLLQSPHIFHRWDTGKDNPYLGMLACSDGIIVTGDSLSMCAEACVVGAPVFVYASDHVAPPKHRALHQALYDRGMARPLNNLARLDWQPLTPLDDVGYVAAEIQKRFPEIRA